MLISMENSILCFEALTHTQVVIYAFDDVFRYETRSRWIHPALFCHLAKKSEEGRCVDFDFSGLKRHADFFARGGVKICHAGAMEWVYSIFRENHLLAILVAGIRRPPENIPDGVPLLRDGGGDFCCSEALLQALQADELTVTMEALCQLGARLRDHHSILENYESAEQNLPPAEYLRSLIFRHSQNDFSLIHLAELLHLSPSRTAHRVKEVTGVSFSELLIHYRLERAVYLLYNTSYPVTEVAERSGFNNTAHFHRMFQKRFGCTPLCYRKQERGQGS